MCFATGVDKEAKAKIKQLVKHFVPDLFFAPRGELSDDDGDLNDGKLWYVIHKSLISVFSILFRSLSFY